jgi:hypothetical protein
MRSHSQSDSEEFAGIRTKEDSTFNYARNVSTCRFGGQILG